MSMFQKRRVKQVLELLKINNVDVLILFPGANIAYYTGFPIGMSERLAAAVIPVEGEPYFVVNKLEGELRGLEPWFKKVEVWDEHEDPVKLLADTLRRDGYEKGTLGIPIEAPWGWVNALKKHLPEANFVDVGDHLGYIRMIKTSEELETIEKACMISDEAMEEAFTQLHTGMTEKELQALMVTGMQKRGASRAFAGVLFGERAALPHGGASDRKLKPGEFVLVDMGGLYKGYWSDCTRTVMYGEPSDRQKEIYEIVLRANRAAFDAIKPGVTCESIDIAARDVIDAAGYGDYFIHRLGHGVGMEIHEHPYMVRNNHQLLESNMVFSDEPGIYIVGEIGVRVEDTVVCTEDGARTLTHFDRELRVYPERG
ncbi:MAG: Xaa-Pro peptidase family protein [Candidatus Bathyarchaeota archaeon]|nr:Xaa-Pro peptidase family protein [Candidatus Bathyarchaeota archaeon]